MSHSMTIHSHVIVIVIVYLAHYHHRHSHESELCRFCIIIVRHTIERTYAGTINIEPSHLTGDGVWIIMRKTWNLASTWLHPLVVLIVCASLGVLNWLEQRWQYVLPLGLLAGNAGFTFAFWSWRLKKHKNINWLTVALVLGLASRFVAILSTIALVAVLTVAVTSPSWVEAHIGELDAKYWVLSAWLVLEVVHGHVYKLTHGMRNTLEDVIVHRRWREAGVPLGGAIGEQLRKLRQRRSGRNYRRDHA